MGQKETAGLNHTWPCLVSGAHLGKGRQRWGFGGGGKRERDCFFSLGEGGGGPAHGTKIKDFRSEPQVPGGDLGPHIRAPLACNS